MPGILERFEAVLPHTRRAAVPIRRDQTADKHQSDERRVLARNLLMV